MKKGVFKIDIFEHVFFFKTSFEKVSKKNMFKKCVWNVFQHFLEKGRLYLKQYFLWRTF